MGSNLRKILPHFKADTNCACIPINMNGVYLSKNYYHICRVDKAFCFELAVESKGKVQKSLDAPKFEE